MPKSTAATNHSNKSAVRDVLVQVQSRGLPELTERARERLTAMEQRDKERMQLARQWMKDLRGIADNLDTARLSLRDAKYQALADVYSKYMEIEEHTELRMDFYRNLRSELLEQGYKVQKNTPDAGLLIRLVWGKGSTASSINQYVNVLRVAQGSSVNADGFVDWIKRVTISKATVALTDDKDRRKERLQRARILILKYLDWRETHPRASLKILAANAYQYVTEDTNLVVMLGTVVRRFDRESDYADVYISHILPPNIGFDIDIMNRWAKYIEVQLERHEESADEIPLEQWATQLEDELWALDLADAEKQSVNWKLRQQAALHEDQQAFDKYAQAFKREKSKAKKNKK